MIVVVVEDLVIDHGFAEAPSLGMIARGLLSLFGLVLLTVK